MESCTRQSSALVFEAASKSRAAMDSKGAFVMYLASRRQPNADSLVKRSGGSTVFDRQPIR